MKRQLFSLVLILVLVLPLVFTREETGDLSVTSHPDGASISLGGVIKGITPATLTGLRAGKVAVRLTKTGYKDDTRVILITPGEVNKHDIILAPLNKEESKLVTLRVDADQPGAYIYLDGELKGLTPRTITRLNAGQEYTIKVTKTGYQDYIVSKTLRGDLKVSASLVSLSEMPATKESPVVAPVTRSTEKKVVKPLPVSADTLMGHFVIESTSADAAVYIDGLYQGMTPLTVAVAAVENHEIKISKEGYHEYVITRYVDPDEYETISATLVKKLVRGGETGSYYVASTPGGATVYVDGQFKGTTPVLISGLSLGEHDITVSKVGYKDYKATKSAVARMVTNIGPKLISQRRLDVRTGNLFVSSTPVNAHVYVDGEIKGETPLKVEDLYTGNHDIKITKEGYVDYTVTKQVPPQRIVNVVVTLAPQENVAGEKGTLYVRSVPSRADVYLDGQLQKGKTPYTVSSLPVGQYAVKVVREGYSEFTTTALINARKTTQVWARFTKEK